MVYQHTQAGWTLRIALGLTALGLLAIAQFRPFDQPAAHVPLLVGAAIAVAIAMLWSTLTIRIDGARLRWSFGPGWPRFSLPLVEIQAVEVTRTTFFQGWGVHRTRRGWLYNVAGFDAVLVTRRDGRQLLLGTDEPRRLKAALERTIAPGSRA
jgi:hypothetical protein